MAISLDFPRGNEIVALGWDVVDWLARARRILGALAGIPNKDKGHRAMMGALEVACQYRDMLQHYDRDVVDTMIEGTFPVMGSVIVVFRDAAPPTRRAILNTPARYAGDQTISIAGAKLLMEARRAPVDNVTLSLASATINLSSTFAAVDSARNGLREYLKDTYDFDWNRVDGESL